MPNFFRRKFLATSAISASAIVLAQTKVYAADAVQKLKNRGTTLPAKKLFSPILSTGLHHSPSIYRYGFLSVL